MDFTKAIELNPQFADSYDRRGEIYLERGDRVRAGANFIKAAQLRKTDPSPEPEQKPTILPCDLPAGKDSQNTDP